ncbi:unnamed protein product [Rhizophagus irregularis]|nr:unnamed protein product [Rhizophagus irregularis]
MPTIKNNLRYKLDPLKRPNADELKELTENFYLDSYTDSVFIKQIKDAGEINKKPSSTVQPPLSTSNLLYTTHSQAFYTSRLLNFKNLPEPKNANSKDDLLVIEYSESIKVDFTKLNINSEDCN